MSDHLDERHLDEFHRDGCTVFRGIVPPALVRDLRRVAERARGIAHRVHGRQAQRLQPLEQHLDAAELRPVRDYRELPALAEAVARVLSPRHAHATARRLGLLFEPAERPWATRWHRDGRDNRALAETAGRWGERYRELALFNQANCALYEDDSLWVVPGSHLREDLPGEARLRGSQPPGADGIDDTEAEVRIAAYCRSMPGATRVRLGPGDYALYRNCMWHLGSYVPYRRRATIHDAVDTPEFAAWRHELEAAER